ncbi:hypothetical protein SAMD00019534_008460 [Acytostelium subglobosum LB1]|uniref:hypothetical protein n=1 Tax=Acytostelium subglobosum LB1 TaxID=1410327 RepID=UPI000644DFE6|nr:hypothetical protein SAMD00019534_008460 [Acytostelium subglobosum LB1]GAM17671.1 hypothetical protein SAMD00019534_008460 [Acytostelium subglobosum LB1]|eukprot:XP_012758267.1 hypothetical protein SAMD00019534_008460 [Acytostelium subglobosum LB1]
MNPCTPLATPASTSIPSIAIIGAGISGLVAARILQLNDIPVTIYESDKSPTSRFQGGTLDLHPESGQHAVKEAGLWDDFIREARPEGQDFLLMDKHTNIHLNKEADPHDFERPEIDRGTLRDMFINSLKEGTILWGTRVNRIQPTMDGSQRHTVIYNNDLEATFDLVIGADGAWSKVRTLLSKDKPAYTNMMLFETRITDADRRYPAIAKLVGRGSCFVASNGLSLIGQRNSNGCIRIYPCFYVPEDEINQFEFPDKDTGRNFLLKKFEGWDEKLRDMIRFCDDDFTPRPIYALPVPHTWETKPGLTIIGDAAHLMSPFAGEGANLAMWDGCELALGIVNAIKNNTPILDVLQVFEKRMHAMCLDKAELSASNLELYLRQDSLDALKERWTLIFSGEYNPDSNHHSQ